MVAKRIFPRNKNSKSEARNPKQIRGKKNRNPKQVVQQATDFVFRILDLFRVSDFVLRNFLQSDVSSAYPPPRRWQAPYNLSAHLSLPRACGKKGLLARRSVATLACFDSSIAQW
jgi:hypothetical protein